MISLRPVHSGIARVQTKVQAMQIADSEKAGTLMFEMDAVCRKQFTRAFVSEGGSTGQEWTALSPRYAAWKRRTHPGRKILVLDGGMRSGFVLATDPSHIRRFSPPFSYQFGIASEKAWKHENGVGEPGQRLPRRSVVRKTDNDIREFQLALRSYYIKRLRQVYR